MPNAVWKKSQSFSNRRNSAALRNYFINLAWKSITAETVQNCWKHAGVFPAEAEIFVMETTDANAENGEIDDLISRIPDLVDPMSAADFIQLGEDEAIGEELTDQDIISMVAGNFAAGEEEENDEEIVQKPPPSRQEARAGLQSALAYFEANSDTFGDYMPQIKKMMCKIDEHGMKMAKQTSILNYF